MGGLNENMKHEVFILKMKLVQENLYLRFSEKCHYPTYNCLFIDERMLSSHGLMMCIENVLKTHRKRLSCPDINNEQCASKTFQLTRINQNTFNIRFHWCESNKTYRKRIERNLWTQICFENVSVRFAFNNAHRKLITCDFSIILVEVALTIEMQRLHIYCK